MSDTNHVTLTGRLTRDAEIKFTQKGMAVGNLGLAVNRSWKVNDEWKEEVSFFDIEVWSNLANRLADVKKGQLVFVEGELKQESWQQDDQKRSKVKIKASQVRLLVKQEKKEAKAPAEDSAISETGVPTDTSDLPF